MRPMWQGAVQLVLAAIVGAGALWGASAASAVEVGQEAPDFSLSATSGGKISLSQFRGKQPVLIEFYSADFAPV